MGSTSDRVRELIWHGIDPYAGFPAGLYATDFQGWRGAHPWLKQAVAGLRSEVVIEVGVWKGTSTIAMADTMRQFGNDGCVIAVDTWRGGWDHWINQEWFDKLTFEHGEPQIMRTFMQNVIFAGVKDYVIPLPLDSTNASHVIHKRGITPSVIHIDGGHDYEAVMNDLRHWWPLLADGGVLIGDDYHVDGLPLPWPEVRRAFDDFFGQLGISTPLENYAGKCRMFKSGQ